MDARDFLLMVEEGFDAADSVLDGAIAPEPAQYSAFDIAELSGLPVHSMERLWRAAGLQWPDPSVESFSASDLGIFSAFALGCEIFGEDSTLHFTRAMGVAMARVSHAAVSLFLVNTAEELRDGPAADQRAAYEVAGASFNTLPPVMERLLRLHAHRAVERWRNQRAIGGRYDIQWLAVGFVDLVGFTEQTRDLPPARLADLIVRFETEAYEAVTGSGGEVVKLIGDEVMYVADTAEAASHVALALSDAYAGGEVTPRGGIAFGSVLARGGDFYGPVVNVASRLTGLAVPGEVLVTTEVRDAAATKHLCFNVAGRRLLKGFVDPIETFALSHA
ncbi:MAG TPA: adenylate/guanylate cyclase domain-containing protein [Acidimicrobiales bacterium]|nr:adenylate/guanylate cyclase domain-containing protein [Acidimicrobiales bacterium]